MSHSSNKDGDERSNRLDLMDDNDDDAREGSWDAVELRIRDDDC